MAYAPSYQQGFVPKNKSLAPKVAVIIHDKIPSAGPTPTYHGGPPNNYPPPPRTPPQHAQGNRVDHEPSRPPNSHKDHTGHDNHQPARFGRARYKYGDRQNQLGMNRDNYSSDYPHSRYGMQYNNRPNIPRCNYSGGPKGLESNQCIGPRVLPI